MEFKVSLRDRLRRTRSSIISFSQPITLFVKPNAYFNSNTQKRPSSSITEPPCIPRDVEKELRYACHRLQRKIERGIPSYNNYHRPEVSCERRHTMAAPAPQINTAPQTQSLPTTLRSPRNRYYPGLEFDVQQSEPEKKDDISELYDKTARIARAESTYTGRSDFSTSRIPSSATKDGAHADGEQPHSSGETLVEANDHRLSHGQRYSLDVVNESYPEVPLDLIRDLNSMPHIVPSLSRPPAPAPAPEPTRLVRKKRIENLQEESESQSQTNTDTETETDTETSDKATGPRPKYRYSWLPNTTTATTRPVRAMELGMGVSPPVIIDSKGQRQVMDPAAEQQRHKDLQQAVKEKMYTGMIKPRPVSDAHNTRPCANCSDAAKSTGITDVNETGQQLSRRRSILRKFSFFSLAKLKNNMPRAKEAAGFSRIVDVV